MLGESMTARNNSSWWTSIYLLPGGTAAQMRGHATRSASGAFPKLNRSNAVMTIPQIFSFRDKLRLRSVNASRQLYQKTNGVVASGMTFPVTTSVVEYAGRFHRSRRQRKQHGIICF